MNINSVDLNRPNSFSKFNYTNQTTYMAKPALGGYKEKTPSNVKVGSAISSLLGTGTVLTMIVKKQGFPINPQALKNIPLKDWAIFKIAKKGEADRKLLKIEEKEIIALATGSVAGGLVGGALIDGKNMKAKGREALTQMAGNVLIPVGFVGAASRIYSRFEKNIKSILPQVKNTVKHARVINKVINAMPVIATTATALGAGIYTGSKVTNFINKEFFEQKKIRRIKTTDFAPHVDDLCLAVTLMGAKDSPVVSTVTRAIPLFLAIPGYQVGKARE